MCSSDLSGAPAQRRLRRPRSPVRARAARVGRNPKTGVEVPIDPRRVLVFKPSNIMKARINGEAQPDYDGF